MPRLSVVTACFNGAAFLERTVRSVQNQSFTDWELIIVDDGSSDESYSVADVCAKRDSRVRVIQQSNQFLSRARNNGFAHSAPDSEYLLFLDADDLLEPHTFATMVAYLEKHERVGAAYHLFRTIDAADVPLTLPTDVPPGMLRFEPRFFGFLGRRSILPSRAETPFCALASYHQAIPSCTFFRRAVFERAGLWDTAFSDARVAYEDKDLILRIALLSQVHLVNEVLTLYRRHTSNVSSEAACVAGHRFLRRHWQSKQLPLLAQKRIVRNAFIFDSYLAAVFTLEHAGRLLLAGRVFLAMREFAHGMKKFMRVFTFMAVRLMRSA